MAGAGSFTTRPVYMGRHGLIASGHYLAARAGQRMFDKGGNAIDAAVASGFAVSLLEPHMAGIGGEVPILVYTPQLGKPVAISGQGWAGSAATIDWFRQAQIDPIPGDGFLPATVPAALGTWALALQRFGTLRLKDVLEPTIDLAESGFPMYQGLRNAIASLAWKFRTRWPTSAAVYLPDNRVPEVGTLFRNLDLAATFKRVVEVEMREKNRGREAAIQAAVDYWYQGDVAERIVQFMRDNTILDASRKANKGLLSPSDFAEWRARVEEPVTVNYRGLDVYKCSSWTQGPVFLQQLRLLEGFDLAGLGHNSASYIHTVLECAKLAFADRERFYGDPDFTSIPFDKLLARDYAGARRALIDPYCASLKLRPGDDVVSASASEEARRLPWTYRGDTTHTCALDIHGNMIAATPSGGWIPSSPVIPGLGFPMGTRAQMFNLDPRHPNCLAPRKRPRATLTPSLVLKDGQPYMVFGTPGGDQQDQWTLQFFLNVVDFGMNLQEAIDKPTFHSIHCPSSFYPHGYTLGGAVLEGRIPERVRQQLQARGHRIRVAGNWSHGKVMAVRIDLEKGVIAGAVSPRRQIGYVSGD
jgi:gamma-glutamyltranspeptidase/glutathione hydrolase